MYTHAHTVYMQGHTERQRERGQRLTGTGTQHDSRGGMKRNMRELSVTSDNNTTLGKDKGTDLTNRLQLTSASCVRMLTSSGAH